MVTSDTERREVAAKLRGNPEDTPIPHRTGRHHGMGCHEAADRFWNMCDRIKEAGNYDIAFSTTSVLADLIEPTRNCSEPTRTCGECDRDALLALADELEEDACWEVQTPGDTSGAWRLKDACDRIREALGVVE